MLLEPIFKGATRPACVWGVPIKPFIAASGIGLLLSFWIWMPLILILPLVLYVMHAMTSRDDQAFRQLWINWQTRRIGQRNRKLWGSVSSFSPLDFAKKKKDGRL